MKNKIFIFSMLAIALVINSCSKDECSCDTDNSLTGGLISVAIIGESCDGIPLNDSITADKYSAFSPYKEASFSTYNNENYFEITRYVDNIESNKKIMINIREKDNVITYSSISITYFKILDDKKYLFVNFFSYQYDNEITNFSYDKTTGIVKGNFIANSFCVIEDTSIKKMTATGDFNVQVTELVN